MKAKNITVHVAIIALLLAAITITPGCKKSDKDKDAIKDYTFSLKLGSPVQQANVVLYRSREDYYTLTNPVVSGRTDAEGTYVIPASKLVKGTTYYADIYTDDYSYSNWSGDNLIREFVYGDNNSFSNYGYKTTISSPNEQWRMFYLDGNKLGTDWKAVDAREPGTGSVWNSISAADQLRKIRFNRDATAAYTEKDGALNDVTTSFTYTPQFQNDITGIGCFINARPGSVDTAELVDSRNGLKYYFIKE